MKLVLRRSRFLAVIGERGGENDGTSYIEAIGLADKALAALDAPVKVPDELDQDVEDFGSSMYAAGWNAYRDALLSAQEPSLPFNDI